MRPDAGDGTLIAPDKQAILDKAKVLADEARIARASQSAALKDLRLQRHGRRGGER